LLIVFPSCFAFGCRREPFHIDESVRRQPGSVRDEFDHADNIVLAVPYNRNGAQKPVKRCKSSNFGLACDYDFLEYQLEELRSKISTGYARGRLPSTRDRKE
jgi:hypothetical protein